MITFRASSHIILRNVGEHSPALSVNRQDSYTLSPQYSTHHAFTVQLQKVTTASSHANFPDTPPQLWDISQRPGSTPLENSALVARIVTEHSKSQPFDGAWLADGLQEEVAGEFSVRHVSPMVIVFLLASASAQLEYTCRL